MNTSIKYILFALHAFGSSILEARHDDYRGEVEPFIGVNFKSIGSDQAGTLIKSVFEGVEMRKGVYSVHIISDSEVYFIVDREWWGHFVQYAHGRELTWRISYEDSGSRYLLYSSVARKIKETKDNTSRGKAVKATKKKKTNPQ